MPSPKNKTTVSRRAASRKSSSEQLSQAVSPTGGLAAAATPRRPQRAPGKVRFELLIDAADRLLIEREASAISLYDIAELAGVPAASVYHFLPSISAAFVALAQRYLESFREIISQPFDHEQLSRWQDIFDHKLSRARDFYESHDVACKLFLGSEYSWQVRQADVESNRSYAELIASTYDRHFHVPDPEMIADKIEIAMGLSDTVLSLSYLRHGHITEVYAADAALAYHAYLRNFIPEFAPKRVLAKSSAPVEAKNG